MDIVSRSYKYKYGIERKGQLLMKQLSNEYCTVTTDRSLDFGVTKKFGPEFCSTHCFVRDIRKNCSFLTIVLGEKTEKWSCRTRCLGEVGAANAHSISAAPPKANVYNLLVYIHCNYIGYGYAP